MKALILVTFFISHLFYFQANGQTYVSSTKDFIEVEAIVKKSQQKYDEAKKKVFRAEEKLVHMKKIGVLSYNELTKKEQLLKKAKDKLEQMRLLLKHNTTLVNQIKSNPSFQKSIRSTAANSNAKSQRKTIQDVQQEKINRLREQQKQALIGKVNENRNKIKRQKVDSANKTLSSTEKTKPKKRFPKNKNRQSNN